MELQRNIQSESQKLNQNQTRQGEPDYCILSNDVCSFDNQCVQASPTPRGRVVQSDSS